DSRAGRTGLCWPKSLSAVRLTMQTLTGEAVATAPAVALANSVVKGVTMSRLIATVVLILTLGLGGTVTTLLARPKPEPKPNWPPDMAAANPGTPAPEEMPVRIGIPAPRHPGPVYQVTYSPDGKTLASGGYDKLIRLWDATTGAEICQFVGHEGPV